MGADSLGGRGMKTAEDAGDAEDYLLPECRLCTMAALLLSVEL